MENNDSSAAPAARQTKRRKVLSCLDCRRRKQKCDRNYPVCTRCQKAGLAASCTYDSVPQAALASVVRTPTDVTIPPQPYQAPAQQTSQIDFRSPPNGTLLNGEHSLSQPHSRDVVAQLHAQNARIANLEGRLLFLEGMTPAATSSPQGEGIANTPSVNQPLITNRLQSVNVNRSGNRDSGPKIINEERIWFKGRGFKTEFYGQTGPWSTISAFAEEVKKSYHENRSQSDALYRLIHVAEELEAKAETEEEKLRNRNPSHLDLVNMLPTKPEVDRLLELYFAIYGNTYHVLHGPTFWNLYKSFWENPVTSQTNFVLILILCIASVKCTLPEEPPRMIGDSAYASDVAIKWIEACDDYLRQQELTSHFRRPVGLQEFQIQCLLLLAKKANFFKTKLTWKEAGALLQLGLEAGFHRELQRGRHPTSVFEKEMRRRIWAVILNLELEISIERGMPSLSTPFYQDSAIPLNIEDDDLSENLDQLPDARVDADYTGISFLHHTLKSLQLRVTLNVITNDPSSKLTYEEVMRYHKETMQHLEAIPQWAEGDEDSQLRTQSALPRIMLDIQLRQFLMFLHFPHVSEQDYSRIACIEAASQIISLHNKLSATGNHALPLMRRDVLRAALYICQCILVHSPSQSSVLLSTITHSALQQVKDALSYLFHKIIRHGHGVRSYWLLNAVCEVLRRRAIPNLPEALKTSLTDRMVELYKQILEYQIDTTERDRLLAEPPKPSCSWRERSLGGGGGGGSGASGKHHMHGGKFGWRRGGGGRHHMHEGRGGCGRHGHDGHDGGGHHHTPRHETSNGNTHGVEVQPQDPSAGAGAGAGAMDTTAPLAVGTPTGFSLDDIDTDKLVESFVWPDWMLEELQMSNFDFMGP